MRNLILLLLLPFSIVSYGQTDKDILSFNEINKADFDGVNFSHNISIQKDLIKKEGGKIRIPNKNRSGSFVEFIDDTRLEENRITNIYHGFYTPIKRHLIETNYYEGSELVFIGQYSNKTKIWSLPIFSADNQYFLTYMPYGLEGEPVGIQVWKVDSDNWNSPDGISLTN